MITYMVREKLTKNILWGYVPEQTAYALVHRFSADYVSHFPVLEVIPNVNEKTKTILKNRSRKNEN